MLGRQDGSAWRVAVIFAFSAAGAAIAPSARAADAAAAQACNGSEPQYSLDQQMAGCNEVIAQNPNDATALNSRGVTYATKGEIDKAIADYNSAIQLNPNYTEAFNDRCSAYESKGRYALAITDCTRAIQLKPDYANAFNNRGRAYAGKGQYDLAIADYQQALKLNPYVLYAAANLRMAQDAKAKAAASVVPAYAAAGPPISCVAEASPANSAHPANTGIATMATAVLEHMKDIKDYRDLSALYDNNRTNAAWAKSAEGIAVADQLRRLRADAAATIVVATPEGRALQYSIGGTVVTDAGISVHDLERSEAYRETMANAIALNIMSNPLSPAVHAALAACRAAGSVAVLARGLPISAVANPALQIVNVPANSSPPVPAGLKVTCMPDAKSLTPLKTCPVIKYRGITTWVYSFVDNRVSFALVSYDAKHKIVRNVTKDGARYVWQITSDPSAETVTLSGQTNRSVTATWHDVGP
jgi:tetratricopeptide (TPR) repeat protein